MKCAYCNKEVKEEEALFKEGKYWHRNCLRQWLRKKGC